MPQGRAQILADVQRVLGDDGLPGRHVGEGRVERRDAFEVEVVEGAGHDAHCLAERFRVNNRAPRQDAGPEGLLRFRQQMSWGRLDFEPVLCDLVEPAAREPLQPAAGSRATLSAPGNLFASTQERSMACSRHSQRAHMP